MLTVRQQLTYWALAAAVLLLMLYTLGNVLLPFLVGGAVAYFLDPVADRLQRLGLGRAAATTLIAIVVVLIAVALMLAVIPALINQLTQLIAATPDIINRLIAYLVERFPELGDGTSTLRQSLNELGATIKTRGMDLVNAVIGRAMGVIDLILFLVIVPVVAFYLLLDWDRMLGRLDQLLPRDHALVIRRLAAEVDAVLAGFIRGQLTVCLAMGSFYALGLALAGLQFGLAVGVVSGAITFIPYVGSIVGGAMAIGLALVQFWGDWVMVGVIGAIFMAGQFLEGNILTPRLLGGSVGLHPVWLLFALSAFGALFGFAGMLVAVPVAAAIGVLVRFAAARYIDSPLYRGNDGPDPPAP